jgi:hypothetical protein
MGQHQFQDVLTILQSVRDQVQQLVRRYLDMVVVTNNYIGISSMCLHVCSMRLGQQQQLNSRFDLPLPTACTCKLLDSRKRLHTYCHVYCELSAPWMRLAACIMLSG